MFSCFCLNILIETATDDFEKVTSESLNLSEEEKNDTFFQQEIQQVKKLKNITKIQTSLVQTRNVGQWTVNCCINCFCEAYAVHKEMGASCVIIYSNLRDDKSIDQIKKMGTLSKVFNIIVTSSKPRESDYQLKSYDHCDAEAIVKNIRQTMSECLRKETLAVEERIKTYSKEQYEILNEMKEAAYAEHDLIVKLVQRLTNQTKTSCTKKSMAASEKMDSSPRSFTLIDQFSARTSEKRPIRHSPKRQKSSPAAPVSSFDAEGLFDFEGSDGVSSQAESDIGDSDKEEPKEGIAIPRQRASRGTMAKSLPMNIPTFMSQARNTSAEDLDDYPEDANLDIAASIKALAQSVHGDAVFGELPRPRFSTQI